MISLEFYPKDDDRMGDMLAHLYTDSVPQVGSYVVLYLCKGNGYRRYKVSSVEYWYDCVKDKGPDEVHSVVVEVEYIGEQI